MNENKENVRDKRNASIDSFFLIISGPREFGFKLVFFPDFASMYVCIYVYVSIHTMYIS